MYTYRAVVTRVTDGDTVRFLIDMGMYVRTEQAIRLKDVYAPELSTQEGKDARDKVLLWVAEHRHDREWPLVISTDKDKQTFNRYIGEVLCTQCATTLNGYLRSLGYTNQGVI